MPGPAEWLGQGGRKETIIAPELKPYVFAEPCQDWMKVTEDVRCCGEGIVLGALPGDRKRRGSASRRRDSHALLPITGGVLSRSGLTQMLILLGREVSSEHPSSPM